MDIQCFCAAAFACETENEGQGVKEKAEKTHYFSSYLFQVYELVDMKVEWIVSEG